MDKGNPTCHADMYFGYYVAYMGTVNYSCLLRHGLIETEVLGAALVIVVPLAGGTLALITIVLAVS